MSGFSYANTHCANYKVEYIPGPEDRWFDDADFSVYESDIAWRPGGVFYANKVKIRKFELDCYFEEITIAERESIRRWLGRDTKGRLIFDDKPFLYYNVRPSKIVPGKIYNDNGKYSGTFTVTFTAHDPFGYLTRKSNSSANHDNAADYCGIIASSSMPADPGVSSRSFNVYNPGTEKCGLSIQIAGSTSNPFRFRNTTNGTVCVISSLPSNNLILNINGDTGFIRTHTASSPDTYENGFAYHDMGFIRLDPGMNNIVIQEKNSNGNWTSTSTLSISSISIDYSPRLL